MEQEGVRETTEDHGEVSKVLEQLRVEAASGLKIWAWTVVILQEFECTAANRGLRVLNQSKNTFMWWFVETDRV